MRVKPTNDVTASAFYSVGFGPTRIVQHFDLEEGFFFTSKHYARTNVFVRTKICTVLLLIDQLLCICSIFNHPII